MKAFKLPMNKLVLLVTTILFSPSLAVAQTAPTPPAAPGASAPEPELVADDNEIVVLGRNIPEPMRLTSEVATFLSSADLARTGDDNAAAALTRLAGLSVSNNFVYVRGLGDRYSSALLNGSPLPSPEPLRRQVPLNLFPSNILDGASIQKTFSPNYPGEFGGGVIDLKTVRVPNEPFLTVKGGLGANTETQGEDGLLYFGEGANKEWRTYGGGLREIPDALQNAINRNVRINDSNFTAAELEAIGESLVNAPFNVLQSKKVDDPNFEGEATAGTSFDIGDYNIGLVGVGGYRSDYATRAAQRTVVIGNVDNSVSDVLTSTWDTVANLLGGVSVVRGGHEVSATGLLIRSTTKYAQNSFGVNRDFAGGSIYREGTAWYERQLGTMQLAGKHDFGALDVEWRGAFSRSTRDAPYERNITYVVPDGGGAPSYSLNGGNETNFSYLVDEVGSGGVDASYVLPLSDERDLKISAGLANSNTIRIYESYTFDFFPASTTPQEVYRSRPDFLFAPDNISSDRFEIREDGALDKNYKGRLTVDAAYLAVDAEVMPLLRAALGARYESATQTVDTFTRYVLGPNIPEARSALLEEDYLLPAATLTWNFAEDLQMRLGYSQTIARPQFRELAYTPYTDPDTDRRYQGNPFLKDSEFKNYDARVEYYFGTRQFVTAGAFYKTIDKPIEEVVFSPNGTTVETRFLNAPEATLYGAELEFRSTFNTPFESAFFEDFEWVFGANYTYTHSEVSATGEVTNLNVQPFVGTLEATVPAALYIIDGSELQGTPTHLANLQFGFQTDNTEMTLLAGYVSERISRRGSPGLNVPTVYEDPGVNLDLVFKRSFQLEGTELTLGLSGRNLLNTEYTEYQESDLGKTDFNTYKRGQSFSISLTAKY